VQIPIFSRIGNFRIRMPRDLEDTSGKLLAPLRIRLHDFRDLHLRQPLARIRKLHDGDCTFECPTLQLESSRDGADKHFSRNGLNARCLSLMAPIQAFNLSFDGLDHLIST